MSPDRIKQTAVALFKNRRQKDEEALIRFFAPRIHDLAHLNQILDRVEGGPEMRAKVRAVLVPHLTFTVPPEPENET